MEKTNAQHRISGDKLALKFTATLGSSQEADGGAAAEEESKEDKPSRQVICKIAVLEVDEHKHCVKFSYCDPENGYDLPKSSEVNAHFKKLRDDESIRMFNDTTFDEQAGQ